MESLQASPSDNNDVASVSSSIQRQVSAGSSSQHQHNDKDNNDDDEDKKLRKKQLKKEKKRALKKQLKRALKKEEKRKLKKRQRRLQREREMMKEEGQQQQQRKQQLRVGKEEEEEERFKKIKRRRLSSSSDDWRKSNKKKRASSTEVKEDDDNASITSNEHDTKVQNNNDSTTADSSNSSEDFDTYYGDDLLLGDKRVIPTSIKNRFCECGFSKWGKEWLPILECGPFDVDAGPVRDRWIEMFDNAQQKGRPLTTHLVFWYGCTYEDRNQAYSFVSQNDIISYKEGKKKGYCKLPKKIANKIEKKQKLTKIEQQHQRGLLEIELDVKKEKSERGAFWVQGIVSTSVSSAITTTTTQKVVTIGAKVSKDFFDEEVGKMRPFAGKVQAYDPEEKLYHIVYEDGDGEELFEEDVKEILVRSPSIQAYKIGTKVSKKFFDNKLGKMRPFAGKVHAFDPEEKLYNIVYEDGDSEDIYEVRMKEILVKSSDGSVGDKVKDDDQGPTTNPKKRKVRAPSQLPDMCRRSRPVDVAAKGAKRKMSSRSKSPDKRKSLGKKPPCREEGCTNISVQGGVCVRHGARRKLCREEGCTNKVINGGVCIKHGAITRQCKHKGCTNKVINGGVCIKHGAKLKTCSHEGCTNQVVKGGVCVRHGAEVNRCKHEGCKNQARNDGVCSRHGAKKHRYECSHEGCNNIVVKGGVCRRHRGKSLIAKRR